jgi:hypothetical protein
MVLLVSAEVAVLQFNEFHSPPLPATLQVGLAFIMSSTLCAAIALMLTTVLSFQFEHLTEESATVTPMPAESGHHTPDDQPEEPRAIPEELRVSARDLLYVQIPLVMLEISILFFLVGFMLWYWSLPGRSIVGFSLMVAQAGLMLIFYFALRRRKDGFGWS